MPLQYSSTIEWHTEGVDIILSSRASSLAFVFISERCCEMIVIIHNKRMHRQEQEDFRR
jgi:hypothetical protein